MLIKSGRWITPLILCQVTLDPMRSSSSFIKGHLSAIVELVTVVCSSKLPFITSLKLRSNMSAPDILN